MSDTPTPPAVVEKTVVVDKSQLCRLWTFTLVSIGLNVVILAAFLISAIIHHSHKKDHGFGGRGGGYAMMCGPRGGFGGGFHHGFQRFGGMGGQGQGWGRPGGFGGGEQGPMGMEGGPGMRGDGDFDRGGYGGPGMDRKHDRMGGGFGMRGMMGGEPNQAPDPAKMTDMVLNQLTAKLTLTDDQKAKMKPIIQDQVMQMQKDMEARRVAMQKSLEDTKAKIKTLLNADQQKHLDAIQLPGQKPADAAPSAPVAPATK